MCYGFLATLPLMWREQERFLLSSPTEHKDALSFREQEGKQPCPTWDLSEALLKWPPMWKLGMEQAETVTFRG